MTVPPRSHGVPTPDDLPIGDVIGLASASVDGALDPAELGESSTNPQVNALAAQFAALRTHLQEPATVNRVLQEAHLSAALAAFDALGLTSSGEPHRAPVDGSEGSNGAAGADADVVSLEAARQRRYRRLTPVLAAAAAVAAIGLVVGTVSGRGSSGDTLSLEATTVVPEAMQAKSAPPIPEVAESDAALAGAATEAPADASRSISIAAASDATVDPSDPNAGTSDTSVAGTSPDDQPTYVATAATQIAPIAQSVMQAHRTDGRPLPVTACASSVNGVALARLVWEQHAAVLFVTPNLDRPTQAVVVNAASCAAEITVPLGG